MKRHAPALAVAETWRGRPLVAVAVLVIAGLALRIHFAAGNTFPTVDGVFYLEQARALVLHGSLPWSCFPPGWPALIALPYLGLDHGEPLSLLRAAQVSNVVLGTLMPVLAMLVMKPRLGRWWAVLGLVLLMFLPLDIIYSKNDLSEMAFTCALLGAWLLLERGWLAAAGLVFGAAYLIRPEALLAAGGLSLWIWHRDGRLPWRLLLPLLAVMLPYLVHIRLQTGHFDVTSKTIAVSQSLDAHPGWRYPLLVWQNLGRLLPKLLGVLGVPLVALAVWGLVRRRGAWAWLLAPLLPVPFIINPMDVRFWVPYLPVLLLAAGCGGLDLARQPWLRGRWLRIGLVVAVLGGLGFASRDDLIYVRLNAESFYGLQDAGAWLAPQVKPDTVIAAYKPYTSFWAGCRFIKFPPDLDALSLIIWARDHGAQYIVVNVQVVHHLMPSLDPLLVSPLRPDLAAQVTLVKLFEYDLVEHNTAVYRLNDRGKM